MTMDELLRSEIFLRALQDHYLEDHYEEWLRRIDDKLSSEETTFSPAFLRKMEELINGSPPEVDESKARPTSQ